MRSSRWLLPLLFLALFIALTAPLFDQSARADATIQFKIEFKAGPMLQRNGVPQGVTQKVAAGGAITSIIQLHGDEEYISYSASASTATGTGSVGQTSMLLNLDTKEVTFLDPAGKRYATGRLDDLVAQMNAAASSSSASTSTASIPPAVKAILQSLRLSFSAQKTGHTRSILGVPVSESLRTLTLEMPASSLPVPGLSAGGANVTLAKVVAHAWLADPSDVSRNLALSEFWSRGSSFKKLYDPDTMLKSLSDYPELRDSLRSLLNSYFNDPPAVLKVDADLYLPVLAQVEPLLQAQGKKMPQGFDPNASLGTISMEMMQLSDAPVDPSVFTVPAGYTSVPLNQVLAGATKPATPAPGAAGTPAVSAAPNPSTPTLSPSEKAARAAAILRADQR
jgi:hypothetical protein